MIVQRWLSSIVGIAAVAAFALSGCAPTAGVPVIGPEYQSLSSDIAGQRELRRGAIKYLNEMRKDEYALYRANSIEALQADPELGEIAAREGVEDPNLAVRFVSAMAIGQHQYADAAPLVHALLSDDSASVRAAAAFALKRNGTNVNLGLLAEMLKGDDPRAAGNAALVLGELGDPSALPLLRESIDFHSPHTTPPQQRIVQLQIAEAMAKLGDPYAIPRIRAELYSRQPEHGEIMALAATMLGQLDATRTIGDLRNIVAMWRQYRHSAEVRLAALASLAQLGEPQPIELVLEYLGPSYRESTSSSAAAIQTQAAHALAEYPPQQALPQLARLFDSSTQPLVRLQAAASILRLTEPLGPGDGLTETDGGLLTPDDLQ